MTFLFLFLAGVLSSALLLSGLNCNWVLCPASRKATSNSFLLLLKISWLLDMFDKRASIDWGMRLVIEVGWLDSTFTYCRTFPGLE